MFRVYVAVMGKGHRHRYDMAGVCRSDLRHAGAVDADDGPAGAAPAVAAEAAQRAAAAVPLQVPQLDSMAAAGLRDVQCS